MLAGMGAQIDRGQRLVVEPEHRLVQRRPVASERQDRAVVRRVGLHVEEADPGNRANRRGNPVHDVGPPPFADIRDAFDDRHGSRAGQGRPLNSA